MMEDTTKFVVGAPTRQTPVNGHACLVQIYPAGQFVSSRFRLGNFPVTIGRDEDCPLRIVDDSISRRHAVIQPDGDGYTIVDLQSTNGTFVNEIRIASKLLKDGDYLHLGNCIYRFFEGDNVEAQYHEEIYRLAIQDPLTGLYNKRYLLEFLGRELSCATRYLRPLALALFDLDHFKSVNDRYGHLAGDYVLREVAQLFKTAIRREDVFARYGGEEFALVMPETNADGGFTVADHLRRSVEKLHLEFHNKTIPLTISGGVAATQGDDRLTTVELLRVADEKLYDAKKAGRNRVVR